MTRQRVWTPLASVAIAAIAVLAFASSAFASSAFVFDVKYRVSTTTLDPGETGGQFSNTVRCRNGQDVFSGGFLADWSSPGSGAINTTAPQDGGDPDGDADDAWLGFVDFFPNSIFPEDEVFLRTRAVCLDPGRRMQSVPDVKHKEVSRQVGTPGQHDVVAKCPRRHFVIGGGVASSGGAGEGWLNTSRPADGPDADNKKDDAWRGFIEVLDAPEIITAYANCVPGRIGDRLRYVRDDVRRLGGAPGAVHGGTTAKCPRHSKLVGGGLTSTGDEIVNVHASEPWDDLREHGTAPEDGWWTHVIHDSTTKIFAHAICLR